MRQLLSLFIPVILALVFLSANSALSAADTTFMVDTSADSEDKSPGDGACADAGGKCSLRAAVMESNALVGAHTIILPAETYSMTIAPVVDDDAGKTGDLDITGDLTITGDGAEDTVIDGSAMGDRLFDIQAGELVTISGVTVQKGLAFDGGGIRNKGTLSLSDCTVGPNKANSGAGIFNGTNATLRINNCLVGGNSATGSGGGINNSGELYVENSRVRENGASYGGGIGNYEGSAHITNSFISENSATTGGGIENDEGLTTLKDSTVNDNRADEGAGINTDDLASFSMQRSTVTNNTSYASGAGIKIGDGQAAVTNSTISGNNACDDGGGIYIDQAGELEIYNSTITDNSANFAARLGSCKNFGGNPSAEGGGIKEIEGEVDLYNTILVLNRNYISDTETIADDCQGVLGTLHYSLLGVTTDCVFTNNSSIIGQEPKLGALADNGGPTQTHALLEGSPAIDSGDPEGCKDQDGLLLSTDQRGEGRPADGDLDGATVCDMGAYEVNLIKTIYYLPFLNRQ